MTVAPRFTELIDRYLALDAAGLGHTRDVCLVFAQALSLPPDSYLADLRQRVAELGLRPETVDIERNSAPEAAKF